MEDYKFEDIYNCKILFLFENFEENYKEWDLKYRLSTDLQYIKLQVMRLPYLTKDFPFQKAKPL